MINLTECHIVFSSSLKVDSEPGSKENVAVEVENSEAAPTSEQEKDKKVAGSLVRPVTMRKRSYSFSDGPMKHPPLPPVKRWKSGRGGGGRGGAVSEVSESAGPRTSCLLNFSSEETSTTLSTSTASMTRRYPGW